jgi:hypothetical protein
MAPSQWSHLGDHRLKPAAWASRAMPRVSTRGGENNAQLRAKE